MKTVLITGACGGMGNAAARFFRDRGYLVFALDRTAPQKEERIVPVEADVTSPESLSHALETVRTHTDHLFAIVHFAGIYMLDSLAEMEDDAFCRIFDVNLRGVFLVNRTFLPLLKKGSKILITTSELAPLDPLPFTGIYAVSKAALDRYAYSLRMELQLLGISVSVLRAGAVRTDMLGASTDALERFCQSTKLYTCNAERFRTIVNRVESRCIPPEKIARKSFAIIRKNHASFSYHINRNPLLLLLNALPRRLQFLIIRLILQP